MISTPRYLCVVLVGLASLMLVTPSAHAIKMVTAGREAGARGRSASQGTVRASRDVTDDTDDVLEKLARSEALRSQAIVALPGGDAAGSSLGTMEFQSLSSGKATGSAQFGGTNMLPDDVFFDIQNRWRINFESFRSEAVDFRFEFPLVNYAAPPIVLRLEAALSSDAFVTLQEEIIPTSSVHFTALRVPSPGQYRFSFDWTLPETVLPAGDSDFVMSYSVQWTSVPEPSAGLLLATAFAALIAAARARSTGRRYRR